MKCGTRWLCGVIVWVCVCTKPVPAAEVPAPVVTLSSDRLEVVIDESSGTLSVVDRVAGRTWGPDPWEKTAGMLHVGTPEGERSYNLSRRSKVSVNRTGDRAARIVFAGAGEAGQAPSWSVTTDVSIPPDEARLLIKVIAVDLPER
ncbi:MAG: hypothetical protein ACC645_18435, partial [Pirellulales bacterium]